MSTDDVLGRRGRADRRGARLGGRRVGDRKSTRLNSSHVRISYAVFCLKKKKTTPAPRPSRLFFFFFNDTATTEIYTLSLHDALPISSAKRVSAARRSIAC